MICLLSIYLISYKYHCFVCDAHFCKCRITNDTVNMSSEKVWFIKPISTTKKTVHILGFFCLVCDIHLITYTNVLLFNSYSCCVCQKQRCSYWISVWFMLLLQHNSWLDINVIKHYNNTRLLKTYTTYEWLLSRHFNSIVKTVKCKNESLTD